MNKRTFLTAFVSATIFSVSPVFALARAPVNNSSKLQPLPSYVAPNISGNVNSTLSPASDTTVSPDQVQQPDTAQATSTTQAEQPASNPYFLWIIIAAVIIVVAGLLFLFLKL